MIESKQKGVVTHRSSLYVVRLTVGGGGKIKLKVKKRSMAAQTPLGTLKKKDARTFLFFFALRRALVTIFLNSLKEQSGTHDTRA